MPVRGLLCSAMLASLCLAQPPTFTSASVLPNGGDRSVALSPGLLISIYGEHLGPASACEGHADTEHRETPSPLRPYQVFAETLIYPKELCDTQVLVGRVPAGLQYVQERQINFKVPQETAVEGTIELRVVYRGQSSQPVKVTLGLESAAIFLEKPAKVGLPVWLRVSMFGNDGAIAYPFDIHPAIFWCHDVEVKRNGMLLPRSATIETQAFDGIMIAGGMCGSLGLPSESRHTGRIPLHLQYRFNWPGIYEVRFTMRNWDSPDRTPHMQSAWTKIEILPGTPTDRQRWLKEQRSHLPTGTTELLTDFLPGILGIPDPESLTLLCGYLYHPDVLVRRYAMYGLTYWSTNEAEAAVRKRVRARGPSDVTVWFLARRPELAKEIGTVVDAALANLRSDDTVLLDGAVIAVQRADPVDSPRRERAEAALIEAADHIAAVADPQTLNDCAAALGGFRDKRAAAVLWNWISRYVATEQSAIALAWRKSPEDLPKLAGLALTPATGDGMELSSLPSALRSNYGDVAMPYLETMTERSERTWVRTASARELVFADRPAGFVFVAEAIDKNRPYRSEMIQFLREQFPELRQANDSAVLAFAKARAAK